MKKITLYFEDADGQTDRCTGLHVDNGDGSASWLAAGALDAFVAPAADPKDQDPAAPTWRTVGASVGAAVFAATLDKVVSKAPVPPAPTPRQIDAGDVEPAVVTVG